MWWKLLVLPSGRTTLDTTFDVLADAIEAHLDTERLWGLARDSTHGRVARFADTSQHITLGVGSPTSA